MSEGKPFLQYTKEEARGVKPVPKLLAMSWLEALNVATNKVRQLKAQLAEARAVLKLVEWAKLEGHGSWCSCCGGHPVPYGISHAADCRLKAALGET